MARTTKRTDGTTVTYEDVTDTAKRVRAALKEAFPGVKFSVRCDRSSMSASIDIRWLNGPLESQVTKVVWRFASKGQMDMSDYVPTRTHSIDGDLIVFGADYVFCHREISDTVRDGVAGLDDNELYKLASTISHLTPMDVDPHTGQLRFRNEIVARCARALPIWRGEQRPCPSAESIQVVGEH